MLTRKPLGRKVLSKGALLCCNQKRTKFRKVMKGRNTGLAHRANKVSFGEYGLKATSRGRITARQIEAARRTMTRRIKRGGKIWIRVFPDKPDHR